MMLMYPYWRETAGVSRRSMASRLGRSGLDILFRMEFLFAVNLADRGYRAARPPTTPPAAVGRACPPSMGRGGGKAAKILPRTPRPAGGSGLRIGRTLQVPPQPGAGEGPQPPGAPGREADHRRGLL